MVEAQISHVDTRQEPLIYQLSTSKDGRMYRSRRDAWMILKYCPTCGSYLGENIDDNS